MGLTKVELKGLDDGTDGQIITYDANGNPVAVGPGTDGQVLTSTGAGSPPAFEDAASGTALTGSTDNTICTVTGANAIQGEANLTFDGSTLDCTGKLRVDISSTGTAGSGSAEGIFLRNTNETDNNAVTIFGGADDYGAAASAINFINVDHSANAGAISFDTRTTGNSYAERLRIKDDGGVEIKDGDLIIETAGHGINFHPHGGSNENLLDDYEAGDDIIGKNDSGIYTITDNTKGLPQFINPKEAI